MAYDNVDFPYYPMKHNIQVVINDPVYVATNGSYEYRVKRTQWPRRTFNLVTQTMTTTQKDTIRDFLLARESGLNSFNFTDPNDDKPYVVRLNSTWADTLLAMCPDESPLGYNVDAISLIEVRGEV